MCPTLIQQLSDVAKGYDVSFPNGRICIFSLLSRIVNEYVFFLVPLIGLNKQFDDITLVIHCSPKQEDESQFPFGLSKTERSNKNMP